MKNAIEYFYKQAYNIVKYSIYLLNYLRFKLVLGNSSKFYIGSHPSITGAGKISLGRNFFSNKNLRIEVIGEIIEDNYKLIIGDNVGIGSNVHIGVTNSIIIKNQVLMGSNILITDHNHGNYNGLNQSSPLVPPVSRKLNFDSKILIEENVWIGDGVVILPAVIIGRGSIIGANSVVNKNVPEFVIAAGNPIRILKKYNFSSSEWEKV